MPYFNTNKCYDYSTFIKELNEIEIKIKSNEKTIDVEKTTEWIKNNWIHLQKGIEQGDEKIEAFQTTLSRLAYHNDNSAQKILSVFKNCLTNSSYFETVPTEILTCIAPFLDQKGRAALLKSNISPKTTARIEAAIVNSINEGMHLTELGQSLNEIRFFIKKHGESIKQLNFSRSSNERQMDLSSPGLREIFEGAARLLSSERFEEDKSLKSIPLIEISALVVLCPNLIKLNLDNCILDIPDLLKKLSSTTLKSLNLSGTNINKDGIRMLATSKILNQLEDLNLSNNVINDDEAVILAESTGLDKLEKLTLPRIFLSISTVNLLNERFKDKIHYNDL